MLSLLQRCFGFIASGLSLGLIGVRRDLHTLIVFRFSRLRLVCATSTQEVDVESVKQPVPAAVGCEPVPAAVDDPVPAPVLHGGRGNENSWEHDSSGGSRIISNKAQEGPGPGGT